MPRARPVASPARAGGPGPGPSPAGPTRAACRIFRIRAGRASGKPPQPSILPGAGNLGSTRIPWYRSRTRRSTPDFSARFGRLPRVTRHRQRRALILPLLLPCLQGTGRARSFDTAQPGRAGKQHQQPRRKVCGPGQQYRKRPQPDRVPATPPHPTMLFSFCGRSQSHLRWPRQVELGQLEPRNWRLWPSPWLVRGPFGPKTKISPTRWSRCGATASALGRSRKSLPSSW